MPAEISHQELILLANELGKQLLKSGGVIATAESCTGGWIAQVITEVPGCSAWFDCSFVTYSNAAKIEMLGVKPETLARYGAVSRETALEMVAGALARSHATLAVAVTGVAGPDGGTTETPVGTVYIAWQKKGEKVRVERNGWAGNRHQVRAQSVRRAILGVTLGEGSDS
jgi:nicotinamide-nucleotide amidase